MRTNNAIYVALIVLPFAVMWPHKAKPAPPTIPAVPYIEHRVLLMEELYADSEVCIVEHAYTNHVIRQCAGIEQVRTFLKGFLPADDAP